MATIDVHLTAGCYISSIETASPGGLVLWHACGGLRGAGSSVLGRTLMLPFFATIGAAAGSLDALSQLGPMFCFIVVQLTVHVAVTIAGGRLLRLPMDAVLIASNANIGGPATAAATASSRSWPHMVQPAVLLGSLGYAVGTAIGCAVGKALTLF